MDVEKENFRDNPLPLITDGGVAIDVPVSGSLGLLAMGYEGIMMWRQKKMESAHTVQVTHKKD